MEFLNYEDAELSEFEEIFRIPSISEVKFNLKGRNKLLGLISKFHKKMFRCIILSIEFLQDELH